jgi:hypothetical protein
VRSAWDGLVFPALNFGAQHLALEDSCPVSAGVPREELPPQAMVCLVRSRNGYAASIHTHLSQCSFQAVETMPTDACQFFYDCKGCGERLKPLAGDCCVFCSYGSVPCPPQQSNLRCCVPKVHQMPRGPKGENHYPVEHQAR